MDVASMVLGIISLVFSFFCGFISLITAPVGLILGIIDLVKKKAQEKSKGMAIAGVVMCAIAIFILVFSLIFFASNIEGAISEIEEIIYELERLSY